MFNAWYNRRKVLVTGHAGFKGGWLSVWLKALGATVRGFGLGPPTNPSFYEIAGGTWESEYRYSVARVAMLGTAIKGVDAIFHLAAQPLVKVAYDNPLDTVFSNVMGTAALLEACRLSRFEGPIVVVTSDKVYRDTSQVCTEDFPLGGSELYSASKASCEFIAQAYRKTYGLNLDTVRAGNVIGGGDYAENRLIPDTVRALLLDRPVLLRQEGATRPFQHVLSCVSGYLWLCVNLADNPGKGSAWNLGPSSSRTVKEVVTAAVKCWPGETKTTIGTVRSDIPDQHVLNIGTDKARAVGWLPIWDTETAVKHTMAWYSARHVHNADMLHVTLEQIDQFATDAHYFGCPWTGSLKFPLTSGS